MRVAAQLCALTVLASCTFSPMVGVKPESLDGDVTAPADDGGLVEDEDSGVVNTPMDGGDAPIDAGPFVDGGMNPPDAGETPDTGVNQPVAPVAVIAAPAGALPWDTVTLDGTGSTATNGGQLTFEWTVAIPAGATSGLGVFPGDDQTIVRAARTPLYVSSAGDYVVRLTVSEDQLQSTATATITVAAFADFPLEMAGAGESVRVDRRNGRVWVGTDSRGLFVAQFGDVMATNVSCISSSKINEIILTGNNSVAVGNEDGLELYNGTACTEPSNQFSKRRGLSRSATGAFIYANGDPGVYVYNVVAGDFIDDRHDFTAFGDSAKQRGAARDSTGRLWFGSDENAPGDGVVYTYVVAEEDSPRIDLFPGENDKVNKIRIGVNDEVWIAADRGVAHIASPLNPTVVQLFTAGNGLPTAFNGQVRDAALAGDGDVWFAAQTGIARYKRDVQTMVVIARGESGLPGNADLSGIGVDVDTTRGRSVFVVGSPGVMLARPP